MSALIGPAKAARILFEAYAKQADIARKLGFAETGRDLDFHAAAYDVAAARLEQMMREEAQKR